MTGPAMCVQLENLAERAVTLNRSGTIDVDDLPARILTPVEPSGAERPGLELVPLEKMQAQYIAKVMAAIGGNVSKAAETLGVHRRTLYRMMDRHGLMTVRENENV